MIPGWQVFLAVVFGLIIFVVFIWFNFTLCEKKIEECPKSFVLSGGLGSMVVVLCMLLAKGNTEFHKHVDSNVVSLLAREELYVSDIKDIESKLKQLRTDYELRERDIVSLEKKNAVATLDNDKALREAKLSCLHKQEEK